jgi:transposase
MLFLSLLPGGDRAGLEVEHLSIKPDVVTIQMRTTVSVATCPLCHQPTSRIHSRYTRTLGDLPWHGTKVRLQIRARRFFCTSADCPRKLFAERLPEDVADAHGRKTSRLIESLRSIAFARGGEGGSRLAASLGMMGSSGDTLLRLIRRTEPVQAPTVTVLGVDDWAWRKGQRYGTILCDLQSHKVVDLLPDRESSTLSTWLSQHPGAQVISRDRAGYYAQAAAEGAPQAVQVADRFHLIHNVHEALARSVDRHHQRLREAVAEVNRQQREGASEPPQRPEQPEQPVKPPPRLSSRQIASRTRRQRLYEQIAQLHQQKQSMRAIARQLGVDRETVSRFIRAGGPPVRASRSYPTRLDRFEPYLIKRWQEGCRNAAQIARELAAQGYAGSYHSIRRKLARLRLLRDDAGASSEPAEVLRTPSPKSAAWLLLKEDQELEEQDRQLRDTLLGSCPELKASTDMAREFVQIVRQRQAQSLDDWVNRAEAACGSLELGSFASFLKRDYAAVKAALTLDWSNGQVEGQINRLKLIKREMYGRAKFDLLRQRVLHAT